MRSSRLRFPSSVLPFWASPTSAFPDDPTVSATIGSRTSAGGAPAPRRPAARTSAATRDASAAAGPRQARRCDRRFPSAGNLTQRRRDITLPSDHTRTNRSVGMRIYYDIDLTGRSITRRELHGEDIVRAGRYLIAKTLLDLGAATVDPLSPANPLIFSAGPFAGTSFSNANRTSVGCKSPLTGGIKEANGGGSFSYGLGQLKVAGFTLHGASASWVVPHFKKDGSIDFDDGGPYLGKGNFEAQEMLHKKYGKKVTIALCGPVGEYQGLLGGISFSDKDGRPARLSARGGVGAVMGAKKVKAIVVDLDRIPPFTDTKKVNVAIKDYAKMLLADTMVTSFYQKIGTMGMADLQNALGGLPVRNFSAGQQVDTKTGEKFKMGGEHISQLN